MGARPQQDGSERHISFTTFAERSNKAANAFAQQGIQKGDTILIMLPRIPEWWESVLALMKLGAIFIPCTTLLTPQDIEHRIHVAEAKGFITDSEGAAKLDQIRTNCPTLRHTVMIEPDVDIARREGWTSYHQIVDSASSSFVGPQTRSDDPCLVYFTSGTVGYPKMVLHTHASTCLFSLCRSFHQQRSTFWSTISDATSQMKTIPTQRVKSICINHLHIPRTNNVILLEVMYRMYCTYQYK